MKNSGGLPGYYPIFLNINGKKCVVAGGGQVALRKVKTLLKYGAKVEVISPELCPELIKLAENGELQVFQRGCQAKDLQDAVIAIAATNDSQTNLEIAKEARKKTILVNTVDDAENSDFITPSYLRRGDVTIAVSTAGRSPALARKIRTELEKELSEDFASLAHLVGEVRTEVKQQGIKVNSDTWQEALDLDLLNDLLRRGSKEEARSTLLGNLKRQQK